MTRKPWILTVLAAATVAATGSGHAQVAGSTSTLGITVTEATQLALGWSVKKSVLGKMVYSDTGEKIGRVEDIIVTPERNVSYLILGAGGFIGLGRHDVAIPVAQVKEVGGRLVMPGATQAIVKAMPRFDYASDNARHDRFVASAEQDIAQARARLGELQKSTAAASADAKLKLDAQVARLQADLKVAEGKLSELKQAGATRWKEFQASVSAATARLRKSIDNAAG
jgi:sporulation protein YlmC with PRC-barrel domain